MSFLQQTINATKESNKKYKLERAEYERASNVLFDIAERKIKKIVLQRAHDGFTDVTFDVINDLKLDIAGKWSIPELLFATIFEDTPPVVSRLFHLNKSPFVGFSISTKGKDGGALASVFAIDWAYQMLKPQTQPDPTPIDKPDLTPVDKPDHDMGRELNNLMTAIADGMWKNDHQQNTPRVPNTPGAPVKSNIPVARNIFADFAYTARDHRQSNDRS